MQDTPTGYEAAIRPLLAPLRARALRNTGGNEAEAEDLLQDTLVRALRFWHTFEPGTGRRQWMFTILRNTWLTRVKRASKRAGVEAHQAPAAEADVYRMDSAFEVAESRLRVREAVERLPVTYRDAVRLADLEGRSYREVAETLGCPEGTVMSRLYRGRRKLAELLAS